MTDTADNSQQDDNQATITIRGRTITMSKRTGQAIAWTVAVVGSACAGVIGSVAIYSLGTVVAIVLAVSWAAFAIAYVRRTNRQIKTKVGARGAPESAPSTTATGS